MAIFSPEDKKFYCECGCGLQIHFYNKCAQGHHMRMPEAQERLVVWSRQGREYNQTPGAKAKRKVSLERYWDLLSPKEKKETLENSLQSKTAMEASAEAVGTPEYRIRMRRIKELEWARYTLEERKERLESSFHSQTAKAPAGEASAKVQRTPASRAKRSRITELYWAGLTPEEKEDRLKNGFNSEASFKASKETRQTSGHREKLSRALKDVWASFTPEEKAEKIRNSVGSGDPSSPNKPETMLQRFLDRAFPDMFIPDWIERADIGGRHPDFRTLNGYKLVIESNGSRFHGDWGEEEQVTHYAKYGYDCIVVWADSADDIIFEWPELARRISDKISSISVDARGEIW